MALKKCGECGGEVSTKAAACPKCGAKVRQVSVFTALVVIFFAAWGFASVLAPKPEKKESSPPVALTPEQKAAEEAAGRLSQARYACRKFMDKTLHDPDSAKLKPWSSWYAAEKKNGTVLVQPSGRAKNAFGAYINGTWNCVVSIKGDDIRLVSLDQISP